MPECSRVLKERGEAYPRTCVVHGMSGCPDPRPAIYISGEGKKWTVTKREWEEGRYATSTGSWRHEILFVGRLADCKAFIDLYNDDQEGKIDFCY